MLCFYSEKYFFLKINTFCNYLPNHVRKNNIVKAELHKLLLNSKNT